MPEDVVALNEQLKERKREKGRRHRAACNKSGLMFSQTCINAEELCNYYYLLRTRLRRDGMATQRIFATTGQHHSFISQLTFLS